MVRKALAPVVSEHLLGLATGPGHIINLTGGDKNQLGRSLGGGVLVGPCRPSASQ